ncbi:MAG TPA: Nramp family divalent metal transporter [Methylomusa anaerophila]|uniref:Divalent metal cation transporter MntH n=1 Tax=Methylomusa anaerophila TaxID=1930071 RepID=A0A348AFU1_9FIRM|nr:Nramp family divalent metal transporter [Methylomusa anaerophila]BBB89939.1 divalent metal cation transporter MntH [Methylomusa anaerophila]HML88334.1 Nramp family divalent metal transporter [Methylomusa anaerophila]
MLTQLPRPKPFHPPDIRAREFLKFLGPGILVTVGFIDPGNWASNIAAGSDYGYRLLWMVTLSTIMLVVLQHNVAHLGIATGYCLSEAATAYLPRWLSRLILATAMGAAVATALAEILGMAIALNILFAIPIPLGSVAAAFASGSLLWASSYRYLEKWIAGFVSIVGISFLFELSLIHVDWPQATASWVIPAVPPGSLPIIMSVLGAVVMPHNLFLHSEIIQSRQWNLENEEIINRQLKFEFTDTLFSMIIGWAINSAMIIVAAATFYQFGIHISTLEQAEGMLRPLIGGTASTVFAVALLFAGFSSTSTAGMAGGSIFAGLFHEPYNIKDPHSRWGVLITYIAAVLIIFFVANPFNGLVFSQMMLSVQLPVTIFLQIYLTSSPAVMGKYANNLRLKATLLIIGGIVSFLNLWLLADFLLH